MKIFDKSGFMAHMTDEFIPMKCHFTYDLLDNLTSLGIKLHGDDPDALRTFLLENVPQIKPRDVDPWLRGGDRA